MVLGGGLLAMLIVGVIFARSGGARRPETQSAAPNSLTQSAVGRAKRHPMLTPATSGGPARPRTMLRSALERGVHDADELDGDASAAVWISGDGRPLLAGPVNRNQRMWSMSKAVVSIAALQAAHDRPDQVLRSALADAIRRSDNCAIRRVIVGLQEDLARGVAGTIGAFERVLANAGAHIESTPQAAAAEQACARYLLRHRGGLPGGDLGVAPQFGTAQWNVRDAIAFTHTLGVGAYGAPGAYLLGLMAEPKEGPLEEPAPPSAPPLDWGAGAAFPSAWHPAWKAGWGGSRLRPAHFLAGQIVVLHPGNESVAVAAIFLPKVQPSVDNPGITSAPTALERIFAAVRSGLLAEHVGEVTGSRNSTRTETRMRHE